MGKFLMVRTAAAWIDLLGYGSDFEKIAGQLGSLAADKVIERAFRFHRSVQKWIRQETRIAVVNDGCLVSADLEPAGDAYQGHYWRQGDSEFVRHARRIHKKINTEEAATKDPGARMVVCLGERVHRGQDVPNLQRRHLRNTAMNIEKPVGAQSPAAKDAIDRMFMAEANDPTVVSTRHLQHNLAFARAYSAESLGRRIGLSGSGAYIDSRLLTPPESDSLEEVATVSLLGQTIKFLRAPS